MKQGQFTEEQIVRILHQAEHGAHTIGAMCRAYGNAEHTYASRAPGWRHKYGGLGVAETQRLRQLEQENARLKCLLAASRLQLERLPGYAPDLNPVELVWRYLKRVELRNVCCATLDELQHELRLAIKSFRKKRDVLRALLRHCGYQL